LDLIPVGEGNSRVIAYEYLVFDLACLGGS
jgi:hypothetical protein